MKHVPPTEHLVLIGAVLLMQGAAALMLADVVRPGIALPLVGVGIALPVVVQSRRRRQHISSH